MTERFQFNRARFVDSRAFSTPVAKQPVPRCERHPMTAGKFMYRVWLALATFSLATLILYRSSAGHGPDIVAQEVVAFFLPCLAALAASLVLPIVAPEYPNAWGYSIGTFLLGIFEVIVYTNLIMR